MLLAPESTCPCAHDPPKHSKLIKIFFKPLQFSYSKGLNKKAADRRILKQAPVWLIEDKKN